MTAKLRHREHRRHEGTPGGTFIWREWQIVVARGVIHSRHRSEAAARKYASDNGIMLTN